MESLDGAGPAWLFGAAARPPWLEGWPAVYAWLGARDPEVRARLASVASRVEQFAVERGAGPVHAAVACARAVGCAADDRAAIEALARVRVPASAAADAVRAAAREPLLVLHRGAGGAAKRWTAAGFEEIARRGRARGFAVVDLLGPAEAADEPLPGALAVRGWPLPDVAALLAGSAYVGCDSGVSHLAGAVGARGAVVFTVTDPARWRPIAASLAAVAPRDAGANPVDVADVVAVLERVASLTSRGADTIDPP